MTPDPFGLPSVFRLQLRPAEVLLLSFELKSNKKQEMQLEKYNGS